MRRAQCVRVCVQIHASMRRPWGQRGVIGGWPTDKDSPLHQRSLWIHGDKPGWMGGQKPWRSRLRREGRGAGVRMMAALARWMLGGGLREREGKRKRQGVDREKGDKGRDRTVINMRAEEREHMWEISKIGKKNLACKGLGLCTERMRARVFVALGYSQYGVCLLGIRVDHCATGIYNRPAGPSLWHDKALGCLPEHQRVRACTSVCIPEGRSP